MVSPYTQPAIKSQDGTHGQTRLAEVANSIAGVANSIAGVANSIAGVANSIAGVDERMQPNLPETWLHARTSSSSARGREARQALRVRHALPPICKMPTPDPSSSVIRVLTWRQTQRAAPTGPFTASRRRQPRRLRGGALPGSTVIATLDLSQSTPSSSSSGALALRALASVLASLSPANFSLVVCNQSLPSQ
jgi:hypothetical protein